MSDERLDAFLAIDPFYEDDTVGVCCISGKDCQPFRRGRKAGDPYMSLPGSNWIPKPSPDQPEHHEPGCPWAIRNKS